MNYDALLISLVAGLSTGLGGLVIMFDNNRSLKSLGYSLGFAAGVMIYISFVDLLQESVNSIGFLPANIAFFAGIAIFEIIGILIPHHPDDESPPSTPTRRVTRHRKKELSNQNSSLLKTGIITALGICIHNFPEGIAVYITCTNNLQLGLNFALAIAAHNIPEGIAIAIPIYHSTGSKMKALKYSLLSGLCEPFAAIIFSLLFESVNDYINQVFLAMVAGIMVSISFKELLPTTLKSLPAKSALYSNVLGMMFISISTFYIHGIENETD